MAFLWNYWARPVRRDATLQQTVHSDASSEDFIYNEYQSREVEHRTVPHDVPRQAPPVHGKSETRRLMHRRSCRREEAEDIDNLRRIMEEQSRHASRNRSLYYVRERTTSVSQPAIQSSATSSARGRTVYTARVWNVVSEVESIDISVGRPKPARLREARTYIDESDVSSLTDSTVRSERTKTPEL